MKLIHKETKEEIEIIEAVRICDRVAFCPLDTRKWSLVDDIKAYDITDGYGNELNPVDQSPAAFLNSDNNCTDGDEGFNSFIKLCAEPEEQPAQTTEKTSGKKKKK